MNKLEKLSSSCVFFTWGENVIKEILKGAHDTHNMCAQSVAHINHTPRE